MNFGSSTEQSQAGPKRNCRRQLATDPFQHATVQRSQVPDLSADSCSKCRCCRVEGVGLALTFGVQSFGFGMQGSALVVVRLVFVVFFLDSGVRVKSLSLAMAGCRSLWGKWGTL